MYCSSSDDTDHMCDEKTNPIKNGFPKLGIPGLEDMLWKYNVDVVIWAHEHNYERLWPVYDGRVLNGSNEVKCITSVFSIILVSLSGALILYELCICFS